MPPDSKRPTRPSHGASRALGRRLADVDLRLLRVFRTVAECGGLAASEAELDIGRSTISRHLSDLEARLGMTLCRRGPGGFALTREGERALAASERLLEAIDAFQGEMEDTASRLGGTLRIAAFDLSASNPEAHVDRAIAAFASQAPDVRVELSIEPPNRIEAGLQSGRFELGIVPLRQAVTPLLQRPLYTETMVLCCARDHPLFERAARSDDRHMEAAVREHRYAGFGFRSPSRTASRRLGLNSAARVQSEAALTVLILSGGWLGYLPDHVAAPFIAQGRMRTLAPTRLSYRTTLAATVRRGADAGRRVALFRQCLIEAHGNAGQATG